MADIELVIKIPEDKYKRFVKAPRTATFDECISDRKVLGTAIAKGTPLPKGHGRLIDADALEKKMCDREEELGDDRALWESSAVSVALNMFGETIIEADKDSEVQDADD